MGQILHGIVGLLVLLFCPVPVPHCVNGLVISPGRCLLWIFPSICGMVYSVGGHYQVHILDIQMVSSTCSYGIASYW